MEGLISLGVEVGGGEGELIARGLSSDIFFIGASLRYAEEKKKSNNFHWEIRELSSTCTSR